MPELTHPQFHPGFILEEALKTWLWSNIIEPNEENQLEGEEAFDGWADRKEAEIDRAARERWEQDIESFLSQAYSLLLELQESDIPIGHLGHDLALVRNGNDTGFWAEEFPNHIAEGLREIAESLGALYPTEYWEYGRWFITAE